MMYGFPVKEAEGISKPAPAGGKGVCVCVCGGGGIKQMEVNSIQYNAVVQCALHKYSILGCPFCV